MNELTLDTLYFALDLLLNEDASHFDFEDWSYDTCGHIYFASCGRVGDPLQILGKLADPRYEVVVITTARALGWVPSRYTHGLMLVCSSARYISDLTRAVAHNRFWDPERYVPRHAAALVLEQAVKKLEEENAHDLLAARRPQKLWNALSLLQEAV